MRSSLPSTPMQAQAGRCAAALRVTHDKRNFNVEAYTNSGFVPCVLSGKCNLTQLASKGPDQRLAVGQQALGDFSTTFETGAATASSMHAWPMASARPASRGASAFNDQSVANRKPARLSRPGIQVGSLEPPSAGVFRRGFKHEVKDQQLTAVGGGANANILLNAKEGRGKVF